MMIRALQNAVMRLRYSAKPVVTAPYGLTLGGGCEIAMHGNKVRAAGETYIGLVEVGVGLIPAGGGTKETDDAGDGRGEKYAGRRPARVFEKDV
jgi:3-hydroxyacyl-CoA dehydrogenase